MTFYDAFILFIKFIFLMSPPFAVTVFLTVTDKSTQSEKNALALKIFFSMMIASMVFLFFGRYIFELFGVTLDAFRIGTGALLFLTSVSLVRGGKVDVDMSVSIMELAIVPITIPIIMGPATIGTLLVYGGDLLNVNDTLLAMGSVITANIVVWISLIASGYIERIIGREGLVVLGKLTGLILAAMSAEMIFSGMSAYITQAVAAAN
ncbi:MAG TPA: hypothetical protein DCW60_02925 [Sutterella sp.]|nr:hypothetical protein [Sutterella sp.]